MATGSDGGRCTTGPTAKSTFTPSIACWVFLCSSTSINRLRPLGRDYPSNNCWTNSDRSSSSSSSILPKERRGHHALPLCVPNKLSPNNNWPRCSRSEEHTSQLPPPYDL